MNLEERQSNLSKYLGHMVAIKRRVRAIENMLEGRSTTGFVATNEEFIYLQFRKILELIAFSTLICNSDIYSEMHSNMANHWRAKDILNKIEKLNPNFYPTPITIKSSSETNGVDEFVTKSNGYLTKQEFIDLYEECSNHIHSENPFAPKQSYEGPLNDQFIKWLNKIINLLNPHTMQLVDETIFYYISMGNEEPESVSGNVFALHS